MSPSAPEWWRSLLWGWRLLAIFAPLGSDAPRRVFIICSYALLLLFVAANWRCPGLLVLGLGLFLNLLPIVANGASCQ